MLRFNCRWNFNENVDWSQQWKETIWLVSVVGTTVIDISRILLWWSNKGFLRSRLNDTIFHLQYFYCLQSILLISRYDLLQTNRETNNSSANVNQKKSVGVGVKNGPHFRLWQRTSHNGLKVTPATEDISANSKAAASESQKASHKTRSSNNSSNSSNSSSSSSSSNNSDMTMLQLLAFVIIIKFFWISFKLTRLNGRETRAQLPVSRRR